MSADDASPTRRERGGRDERARFPSCRPIVIGVVVVVCSVGALTALGWAALRWFDEGMTGVHTYESASGAQDMAERMGLVLVDGDRVDYGEVASSFPDSSASLVIVTPSRDRSRELLRRSGLSAPIPTDSTRLPSDAGPHRPPPSPNLVTLRREAVNGDYLVATWDPTREPRTVYITAIET
ncbi:hypothetical protein [Gordonia sp. NPDC003950]